MCSTCPHTNPYPGANTGANGNTRAYSYSRTHRYTHACAYSRTHRYTHACAYSYSATNGYTSA